MNLLIFKEIVKRLRNTIINTASKYDIDIEFELDGPSISIVDSDYQRFYRCYNIITTDRKTSNSNKIELKISAKNSSLQIIIFNFELFAHIVDIRDYNSIETLVDITIKVTTKICGATKTGGSLRDKPAQCKLHQPLSHLPT